MCEPLARQVQTFDAHATSAEPMVTGFRRCLQPELNTSRLVVSAAGAARGEEVAVAVAVAAIVAAAQTVVPVAAHWPNHYRSANHTE